MQPCFTPAKRVKASVNLLSILTADLFEYMDIKTSRKRPCTTSFLSLSNSFCRGIQSKAFLKSTKQEKSKVRCFCGLDFTYLSISIFILCEDAVNCAVHQLYQLCTSPYRPNKGLPRPPPPPPGLQP